MFPALAKLSIENPGQGNLDVRAYIAAIVGPFRIANGNSKSVILPTDQPVQIISNTKQAVAFVSLSLPSTVVGPVPIQVSSGSAMGMTGLSVALMNTQGAGAGNSFNAVVLPGETLYAQTSPGGAQLVIITSTLWF